MQPWNLLWEPCCCSLLELIEGDLVVVFDDERAESKLAGMGE